MPTYSRLSVDLDPVLYAQLQAFAKANNTNIRQVVIQALTTWIQPQPIASKPVRSK